MRNAPMRTHHAPRPRTCGVALIEVLVAILLFAIGILGIVGLQASMLHAQTDSKVRADAANLVDELTTLMWADMGKPASLANLAQYKAGACGGNLNCNGWLTKLQTTLPSGTLDDLSFDETNTNAADANYGLVTIKLGWTMPSGGPAHSYTATFNISPASF